MKISRLKFNKGSAQKKWLRKSNKFHFHLNPKKKHNTPFSSASTSLAQAMSRLAACLDFTLLILRGKKMLRASPQHQWALANTLLKIHPTVLNHQW
jgi:hypothetical protein